MLPRIRDRRDKEGQRVGLVESSQETARTVMAAVGVTIRPKLEIILLGVFHVDNEEKPTYFPIHRSIVAAVSAC